MSRPPTSRPRRDDWPERLMAHERAHRHQEFAWGAHDCATFVADWVADAIGIDPLAAWRGSYVDQAGFEALVRPWGGLAAFVAMAAAEAGIPDCPIPYLQRGDAVIAVVGNEPCLGLLVGRGVAVPTLAGIRQAPTVTILRGWAV